MLFDFVVEEEFIGTERRILSLLHLIYKLSTISRIKKEKNLTQIRQYKFINLKQLLEITYFI